MPRSLNIQKKTNDSKFIIVALLGLTRMSSFQMPVQKINIFNTNTVKNLALNHMTQM